MSALPEIMRRVAGRGTRSDGRISSLFTGGSASVLWRCRTRCVRFILFIVLSIYLFYLIKEAARVLCFFLLIHLFLSLSLSRTKHTHGRAHTLTGEGDRGGEGPGGGDAARNDVLQAAVPEGQAAQASIQGEEKEGGREGGKGGHDAHSLCTPSAPPPKKSYCLFIHFQIKAKYSISKNNSQKIGLRRPPSA